MAIPKSAIDLAIKPTTRHLDEESKPSVLIENFDITYFFANVIQKSNGRA